MVAQKGNGPAEIPQGRILIHCLGAGDTRIRAYCADSAYARASWRERQGYHMALQDRRSTQVATKSSLALRRSDTRRPGSQYCKRTRRFL